MSSPDGAARRRGRRLVRCPRCGSHLIYPQDIAGGRALVMFDRRCPECELRDSVYVGALAAAAWSRDQERSRVELTRLADALSSGGSIEPSDVHGP